MRTTAKPVIEQLQAHILEEFEEEADYQNNIVKSYDDGVTTVDMLKSQIDSMRYNNRTTYQTALDWVEGGGVLIYHYDVQEFLNTLGINPGGKQYSDDKAWKLYCHLIAREMTKLYDKEQ